MTAMEDDKSLLIFEVSDEVKRGGRKPAVISLLELCRAVDQHDG